MNGRDRVEHPACGHCLTGDHRRCYRGRLGCWCDARGHVNDAALRARQSEYLHVPVPAPSSPARQLDAPVLDVVEGPSLALF